jgi:integrase/recombinase XerD
MFTAWQRRRHDQGPIRFRPPWQYLVKRIISEFEVSLMIRTAPSKRDRVLLEVAYVGGLRVSELVNLSWSDVLPRDEGRVQLSITGKGGKVR